MSPACFTLRQKSWLAVFPTSFFLNQSDRQTTDSRGWISSGRCLHVQASSCCQCHFLMSLFRKWSCACSCSVRICMSIWESWALRFWTDSTTIQQHASLSTGLMALHNTRQWYHLSSWRLQWIILFLLWFCAENFLLWQRLLWCECCL